MNEKKELIIDKVEKTFPLPSGEGKLKVLEDVSLYVEEGEIIALLGPSGCGKSTLLNIAAGFERPDEGQVLFMGETIEAPSPQRGVVFQSAVLFPWLTVRQNIAYGLKLNKKSGFAGRKVHEKIGRKDHKEIDRICSRYIQLVGLEGFENYYPAQLSGGMQQRVSLARVLALSPKMLLMDEPFAALDAQTRIAMQQLLLTISAQLRPTVLFVTHDVEEALILADKVYVMSRLPGKIISEIEVPFQRPRPISIIGSAEFSRIKSEILELLFN